ncbi:hypothetical protein CPC08DRAFT_90666 [Agrocybe pediades]|nr:hypothetical protein CPC08DRAFT_90666 [Agrocybe pediades]
MLKLLSSCITSLSSLYCARSHLPVPYPLLLSRLLPQASSSHDFFRLQLPLQNGFCTWNARKAKATWSSTDDRTRVVTQLGGFGSPHSVPRNPNNAALRVQGVINGAFWKEIREGAIGIQI